MSAKKHKPEEKIDTELLRHFMLGGTDNKDASYASKKSTGKVDLHLDETSSDYDTLNDNEKLDIQLKHLEKQINRAIANGSHKLDVVHGKGAGKLKDAVHALLKKHPAVRTFRTLDDRRHQGGATEVTFK